MRAAILATLGVLGCGRLGIDATAPGDALLGDAPGDAPAGVPAAICKVKRIGFSAPPALAQLAIAGTSEGYAAVWLDPAEKQATQGVLLGPNHDLLSTPVLPVIRASRIGGMADAGQKIVLATGDGASQSTWALGRDLAAPSSPVTFNQPVVAHNPFPTDDSQQQRLFLTGVGTSVQASLIASDGAVNTASTVSQGTTGQVTGVSCDNGPNHAHCVWTESVPGNAAAARCAPMDVYMQPRVTIRPGGTPSDDCHDAQAASGPSAADTMIVVWTTIDHRVELQYLSPANAPAVQLAAAGSAPKVKFDGTRFWIAWLDDSHALRLSSYDLSGTVVPYTLPGWTPLGPAAFDLVRRGNETVLALVSSSGLDLLTICT